MTDSKTTTADTAPLPGQPEPLHIFEDVLLGKLLPLLFFGFFTIAHATRMVGLLRGPLGEGGIRVALELVSVSLNLVFFFMMTWLYIMRSKPRGRTEKFYQRVIALAGSFVIMFTPLFASPFSTDMRIVLLALGLQAAGGVLTVFALSHLRRNFSIIPEARSVVQTGPYRKLRHPMYTSEIIWCAGLVLPVYSLGVVVLYGLMILFLFLRARFEEELLESHFPEYGEYRKGTWRLVPFVH